MKRFLVLYGATPELMETWKTMSPEEGKKGMEEWLAWQERHKKEIEVFGNPAGKNKRLTKNGLADQTNEICGYSIVMAESHEAATEILKDNPHLDQEGGYMEIMQLMDM